MDNSLAAGLVRVSVISEDRRLDVAVPGALPVVEVAPAFARSLGVLDPSLVHGGYELRRADGTVLDASLSVTVQGVRDGDVLTLARGGLVAEPRVYDDITEAVIDATSENHRGWSSVDNARTALAVSVTFLVVSAVLLFSIGPGMALSVGLAAGGAVVLLVLSAVLARLGQGEAGTAFGLTAAGYGALAGYLAVDVPVVWGWPLAAAGLGAAAAGLIALAVNRERPQIHLTGIAWAVVIGVPAVITGVNPAAALPAYAVTVAVAGAIGNVLPWLAFSSTRISVISPMSDQEIFAAPNQIDAESVKQRAVAGARVLVALRLGVGAAVVVAIPLIASATVVGGLLTAAACLAMMFQSRQAYARSAVLAVMAVGAVGLAVTGLTVAVSHDQWRPALLVVLLVVTAALVSLTLLTPRARLRMSRVADTVEMVIIASLLPLGVVAAGWV